MKDADGNTIKDTKLHKSCYTADGVTYRPKLKGWDTHDNYILTKAGKPRQVKT